jgi:ABC-type multidrug transport system ATPase subunit
LIEVRGLTVAFRNTIALDRVELDIPPGIAGLFGPNGSGKSTLLRAMTGRLPPTAGSVSLLGVEAGRAPEELRRRMGFAGHSSGLYPHLSVLENLNLFGRLYDAPAGASQGLIEKLALQPWTNTAVRDLSAGSKRRAAVARALLHDPDILLLDEPYANVDDESADAISAAIRAWWTPERVGVIATHGAKRLKAFAHSGIILQRGSVVRHGNYARERQRA